MRKLTKLLSLIISVVFLTAAKISTKPDGIYVDDITVQELQELFKKHNYKSYLYPEGKLPPIFLKKLPSDFAKMEDEAVRNHLFLMITAPLALRLNEEIIKEREEILKINKIYREKDELTPKQAKIIEEKAKKYDIFTRLKGYRKHSLYLNQLIEKVDAVSPSIMCAAAAIESNWGTSPSSSSANAIYKELTWYGEFPGVAPEGETKKEDYKIRSFSSLHDAMQSYALKINSHINFESFRFLRTEIRRRNKPFLGTFFAHDLMLISNMNNFIGLLDYTIAYYELNNIDPAVLDYSIVTKN